MEMAQAIAEIDQTIQRRDVSALRSSVNESRKGPPRESIRNLWSLMASMYGHKWVSSYGDEVDPDRVWSAALYGITEEQIRIGMRACVDDGLEWPPTAPQFRAMCQPAEIAEHVRIARATAETDARIRDTHRMLSSSTPSDRRAYGREQIALIKAALATER